MQPISVKRLFLVLAMSAGLAGVAQAADLKQLAEELVNVAPGQEGRGTGRNPQTGKEIKLPARVQRPALGGAAAPAPASGSAAIAIKEEGANVKKEKGVEDVE